MRLRGGKHIKSIFSDSSSSEDLIISEQTKTQPETEDTSQTTDETENEDTQTEGTTTTSDSDTHILQTISVAMDMLNGKKNSNAGREVRYGGEISSEECIVMVGSNDVTNWSANWSPAKNLTEESTEEEIYETELVRPPKIIDTNTSPPVAKTNKKRNSVKFYILPFLSLHFSAKRCAKMITSTVQRVVAFLVMLLLWTSMLFRRFIKRCLIPRKVEGKKLSVPDKDRPKRTLSTYFVHTINVIAIIYLAWRYLYYVPPLPNPEDLGLQNCNDIELPPTTGVRAWHISPLHYENVPISNILCQRWSSIVFHIRGTGSIAEYNRIRVLRNLASDGHHVIAPLLLMTKEQVINAWSHLNTYSKGSSIYLWFDEVNQSHIKDLVSSMCDVSFSPSGIMIESRRKDGVAFNEMESEIGECGIKDNETFKFKLLKCPLSMGQDDVDLQADINACFRAVKMTTFGIF